MTVTLVGAAALEAKLKQLQASLVTAASSAARAGGEAVAQAAKAAAPVRTGRLRDSIRTESVSGGLSPVVEVGSDLPYAEHVETGTYKDAPQPFLGPAVDTPEAVASMAAVYRKVVS